MCEHSRFPAKGAMNKQEVQYRIGIAIQNAPGVTEWTRAIEALLLSCFIPDSTSKENKTKMHYKNGRPASNGDKIVHINDHSGTVTTAILFDAQAGNDYCNGSCAPISQGSVFCPNLKECLHVDDVKEAIRLYLESNQPVATP